MGCWVSCRVDLPLLSLAHASCFSAIYKNIYSLCPHTLFFQFLYPSMSANLSFPSPSLCPHISLSPLIFIPPSLSFSPRPCVPSLFTGTEGWYRGSSTVWRPTSVWIYRDGQIHGEGLQFLVLD